MRPPTTRYSSIHAVLDTVRPPDAEPPTSAGRACLNARERRALLQDIGHVALVLGRALPPAVNSEYDDAAPASPGLPRPDALTSPQARLYFLSGLWAHLAGAMAGIARQPDSKPVHAQRHVSLARSRGDAATIQALARSAHLAGAWQTLGGAEQQLAPSASSFPPPASDSATAQWERALLSERVATQSRSTWANRMAATLLRDIAHEARALARLAAFYDAVEEEAQATMLADAATHLRAGSFLRDCPPLGAEEQNPSFAADLIARVPPAYRLAYHGWRALRRPLDFDWAHMPMLALPTLEAWHLYEIWCCLQVGAALARAGWKVEGGDLLRCTPSGLRLNLATGRASQLRFRKPESGQTPPSGQNKQSRAGRRRRGDDVLCLYYQPLFASANQAADPQATRSADAANPLSPAVSRAAFPRPSEALPSLNFESRSHAMQPDIALHWRGALTLLDPKFKRYAHSEDAQDDVNKMHAYRDAIVTRAARGSKTVSPLGGVLSAWCLFPGTGVDEADAPNTAPSLPLADEQTGERGQRVYAYPAATLEHPFGTAGVGAFGLRPGQPDNLPRLAAFLTALLDER